MPANPAMPYILWFALFQGHVVLAVMPRMVTATGTGTSTVQLAVFAAFAFGFGLAGIGLGFGPFVPNALVRLILRCALAEACGLLGFMLAMMGAPLLWSAPFSAWGALLMLLFVPRPSEFAAPGGR